jgi:hypothetical protein
MFSSRGSYCIRREEKGSKKCSGISGGDQHGNIKELSILSLATMNHSTLFILKYETITF